VRTPHPNPRPTAPRPRALPPGWPPSWAVVRATRTTAAALALAPLLLASCTDDVTANCPPLAHPVEMIHETYGHVTPTMRVAAVKRLAARLAETTVGDRPVTDSDSAVVGDDPGS